MCCPVERLAAWLQVLRPSAVSGTEVPEPAIRRVQGGLVPFAPPMMTRVEQPDDLRMIRRPSRRHPAQTFVPQRAISRLRTGATPDAIGLSTASAVRPLQVGGR